MGVGPTTGQQPQILAQLIHVVTDQGGRTPPGQHVVVVPGLHGIEPQLLGRPDQQAEIQAVAGRMGQRRQAARPVNGPHHGIGLQWLPTDGFPLEIGRQRLLRPIPQG